MKGNLIDGKYEVIRQLGQGGMGAVYEARHRTTGRKVAVKVIVPGALAAGVDIIARFQREARASGSIDSPYVVQVLDAGVDAETGAPYIAMECLAGEDVQAAIARVGPLPPEVVLRITAHACHGLQQAHAADIVHRDIKSANLFLARRDGDSGELATKVLDFGIAKVRASPLASGEDNKLTKTGSMLGSPVYMSPEQAVGAKDLDARSDIFSMGVMMYEALSGATPNGHLENLGALLMAICTQNAQPIQDRAPWVPAEVAAVVHKALERNPEDRYQSAGELRAAALALLPAGDTKLTESMIVALSPELKEHRALRAPPPSSPLAFAETALPVREASDAVTTHPEATGDRGAPARSVSNPAMSTTSGLETSSARALPRPVPWRGLLAAAFGIVALGGGSAVYYVQHSAPPQDGASGLIGAAPSANAAAARVPEQTNSAAIAPSTATGSVPSDAHVETEQKTVPTPGASGARPRASAVPRPAAAQVAPAPSASARPAASAATTPSTRPPAGPALDRNFGE